eukprot:9317384-Alexandrium_andersonii.AAC.1
MPADAAEHPVRGRAPGPEDLWVPRRAAHASGDAGPAEAGPCCGPADAAALGSARWPPKARIAT